MKVYVVVGSNHLSYEDHREWNEAVFASRESAENYVQKQPERYARDNARIDELEKLKYNIRQLTEDEEKEVRELWKRWTNDWYGCPNYRIKEYDVRE